jgi:hypothetical protein
MHLCGMKKLGLVFGLAIALTACSDPRQKLVDALDKEVMAVHDEVMPKMSKVLAYKKEINQKIEACQTQACKDSLQKISYLLTRADEDMMQWMRAFERPVGLDSAEAYYKSQKDAVINVRAEVEEGINAAEKVLSGH